MRFKVYGESTGKRDNSVKVYVTRRERELCKTENRYVNKTKIERGEYGGQSKVTWNWCSDGLVEKITVQRRVRIV